MKSKKEYILEAATELFIKKGYSGTSISDIAKQAKINQSLIYHHFENKETLWKEIKSSFLNAPSLIEMNSLKEWLDKVVEDRVALYERNPQLLRLMQWQLLESDTKMNSDLGLVEALVVFREKGELSSCISPLEGVTFMYSLINGLIYDWFKLFQTKEIKTAYKEKIKKILYSFLKSS